MNNRWVIPTALILWLFLGASTTQNAQDVRTGAETSDRPRHEFALGLLRTINTAEAVEHSKYGAYAYVSRMQRASAKEGKLQALLWLQLKAVDARQRG